MLTDSAPSANQWRIWGRGGGQGGLPPPPPPHTHTHTHTQKFFRTFSVDPASIRCSDMRQSYKKDYTWSKSGYAIVHHCEYNIFLPCSARRKHIPFQDPLSATLILPPSPFGPLALYSQITPKWEWRRVKVSRCKYLTSAPPPSIPGSAPAKLLPLLNQLHRRASLGRYI